MSKKGFGQGRYKNNPGATDGQRMVASEADLRAWVTGRDKKLPGRVARAFDRIDWNKEKKKMEMSNDMADLKAAQALAKDKAEMTAQILTAEKPEVVTDALLKKAKKDPATLHKLAKKVAATLPPEKRAKHAAAAAATLPPEERAAVAEHLTDSMSDEEFERLMARRKAKKGSTKPKS